MSSLGNDPEPPAQPGSNRKRYIHISFAVFGDILKFFRKADSVLTSKNPPGSDPDSSENQFKNMLGPLLSNKPLELEIFQDLPPDSQRIFILANAACMGKTACGGLAAFAEISETVDVLRQRSTSEEIIKAYLSASTFHVQHSDFAEIKKLSQLWKAPALDTLFPQAFTNYTEAFEREQIHSLKQSRLMVGEAFAQAAIKQTIIRPNWKSLDLYRMATGGMPMGVWNGGVSTQEGDRILANMDGLYDVYEGFKSDTFAAKRRPSGKSEVAIYEQFGRDIAQSVGVVSQKDRDGFPGPGYQIENIILPRALSAHYDREHRDSLYVYRKNWPAIAAELNDLARTRFLITRAFIAITGPRTEKYQLSLPGSKHKNVHYSLIIFNANHGNTTNEVAITVPTIILDRELANGVVKVFPEVDLPDSPKDLNKANLRPEQLRALAKADGYLVLDVGSAAVAAGHYEYSLPANAPKVKWPFSSQSNSGHTIHGFPIPNLNHSEFHLQQGQSRQDLNVSPLHKAISEFIRANRSLWSAAKLIRANWSKGNTEGELVGFDFTQSQLEQALRKEGIPLWWNGNSLRMLIEAYKWNDLRQSGSGMKGNNDPVNFPILVPASSQRYSVQPHFSKIQIDTFAGVNGEPGMSFRNTAGKVYSINSSGRGRTLEDAVFFIREVLQYCTKDNVELRLYDRRSLS